MNPKPDEKNPLSQAEPVLPAPRAAEPAIPGAPPAPVQTDSETGEMWIPL